MKKQIPLQIGFTVLLFVFLVCASTWLVLGITPLYSLLVDVFDIESFSGFSRELILRNYETLIEYNMFWGAKELAFPDLAMSVTGKIHFEEVKVIFVGMQYAAMGSALLLIPTVFYARKHQVYKWLKWTIYLSIALIVIVGGAFIIDWEGTFVLFHKLVFNNDYWLFDYATDPVIWILPDEVFLTDAAIILTLIAGALVACGLIYRKKNVK